MEKKKKMEEVALNGWALNKKDGSPYPFIYSNLNAMDLLDITRKVTQSFVVSCLAIV